MGGPDMAPHTPRPAPRSSWGLDRVSEPEGAPTPPPAPRSSWGLDRVSEPEGAPTPPPAPRSSWGLDRVSEPDTAGGSSPPRGAAALPRLSPAPPGAPPGGL